MHSFLARLEVLHGQDIAPVLILVRSGQVMELDGSEHRKSEKSTHIHTYIHTHIHTHIHTYITHTHTYVHTYTRIYIHPHVHKHTHTYIRASIHPYIHTYICILPHEPVAIAGPSERSWRRPGPRPGRLGPAPRPDTC